MPHETANFPFEPGDDDMADFMLDRWLAFAVTSCNWVANRAPIVGTRPEVEIWTHRGTIGTPESPYFFAHTKADSMQMFTGDDVDLTQELYDQPNNPACVSATAAFDVPTSGNVGTNMRCGLINSIAGPYSAYWLFSDTTGEYIHCVVKVNSRQYRHFHIGRLKQIDGGVDIDPESFYQTCHFWNSLDPNPIHWPTGAVADEEHGPYERHQLPFRTRTGTVRSANFSLARPNTIPSTYYYLPGFFPLQVLSATVNAGGTGHAVNDIITLDLTDGVYAGTGTPGQLRVTAETGGVIDTVSVEVVGDYDRLPGDQATLPILPQNGTTGAGVDATFNVTFEGYKYFQPANQDGLTIEEGPNMRKDDAAHADVMRLSRCGVAQSNFYEHGLGSILMACDRNFTANANVLIPIYVGCNFDFQSDIRLGVVAQVPDIFRINMRDYQPEEVIQVGGEDYIVFPMMNNDSVNTLAGEGYSAYEGIAYRRETGPVV